jgi:hypothetical protein
MTNIKECVPESCIARLGNFLLPIKYRDTINNIFTVYVKSLDFFEEFLKLGNNKFTIRFYKRTSDNNYEDLINFENYKESFELPQDEVEPRRWRVILTPHVKIGRGTQNQKAKPKTQKAKPKKQKAKPKTQKPKKHKNKKQKTITNKTTKTK